MSCGAPPGAVVLLALAVAGTAGPPAGAAGCSANLTVFDDGAWVDTSGGYTAESDTLQASLASLGQSVNTFTGISAASFSAGLAGRDLLVVPELENGDLGPSLSSSARSVIRDFVAAGGGLMLAGSSSFGAGRDAAFLNAVFGFSLSGVEVGATGTAGAGGSRTAAAAGTAFAGGPVDLPDNNDTLGFASGLPAGAAAIYQTSGTATVALIPYGAGRIVYLGWDWFDAAPIGGADGGWLTVLDRGLDAAYCEAVDLRVTKSESADPVIAGSGAGNLVYTVRVQNLGPAPATGVQLAESLTLPAGVTVAAVTPGQGTYGGGTWDVGSLAVGAAATLTVALTVGSATAEGTDVVGDLAAVTASDQRRIFTGDDAAAAATSVVRRVDLRVTKTESTDPVVPGSGAGNLTYVVTVANDGPSDASGVALSENLVLPAGVTLASITPSAGTFSGTTWTVGTIPSGASRTLTVVLTVGSATAEGTDVIGDTASVSAADETLVNTGDDTASEYTSVVRSIDLAVTVTDSVDPVVAGSGPQNLSYVVTVLNRGPSEASGVRLSNAVTTPTGVSLDAVIPGGSTSFSGSIWDVGTLAASASQTLTVVLTAGATTASGSGVIADSAAVTAANETRTNTGDDAAAATTSVQRQADLSLTKADLVDPVTVGATLTYVLTVANGGPSDATGAHVVDALPAGVTFLSAAPSQGQCAGASGAVTCDLGPLARQASATVVLLVTVGSSAAGTVSNAASVSSVGGDLDPGPNANTAVELTTVLGEADLSLTKSDSPDPAAAGGTLTYTLTVTNAGPSAATGMVVTDTLPTGVDLAPSTPTLIFGDGFESGDTSAWSAAVGSAGGGAGSTSCSQSGRIVTCTVGTLAAGATTVIQLEVVIAGGATGTLTNQASVTAAESDPDTSNNSASATTTIQRRIDLELTLTDAPDPVPRGGVLTYTVEVTNLGPSPATGVVMSDPLPPELTALAAIPSQGSCTAASLVSCALGSLAAGATAEVEIRAVVSATAFGSLTNTASTTGNETELDLTNNSATAVTTVIATAAAEPGLDNAGGGGQDGAGMNAQGPGGPAAAEIPTLSPPGAAALALALAALGLAALVRRRRRRAR